MPKGIIKKKEDLSVKISFTGNGTLEHWIIINIDDTYINEFLDHVEKLRQNKFMNKMLCTANTIFIFQNAGILEGHHS
jgi:hypothetical protein